MTGAEYIAAAKLAWKVYGEARKIIAARKDDKQGPPGGIYTPEWVAEQIEKDKAAKAAKVRAS